MRGSKYFISVLTRLDPLSALKSRRTFVSERGDPLRKLILFFDLDPGSGPALSFPWTLRSRRPGLGPGGGRGPPATRVSGSGAASAAPSSGEGRRLRARRLRLVAGPRHPRPDRPCSLPSRPPAGSGECRNLYLASERERRVGGGAGGRHSGAWGRTRAPRGPDPR